MIKAPTVDRVVAGGIVSLLGLLLASVAVYDIYADVALQGNSLMSTLFENALPLAGDAAIVASGYWISRERHHAAVPQQTLLWAGVSIGALLALAAWVYRFQLSQGQLKPLVILAQLASMGALAGIAVGVYSGTQRERQHQLEALFENSSDCIAEVRFEDGEPIVQNVNPAFEATFGYDADEIRGRSLDAVIVPANHREAAAVVNERALRDESVRRRVERETAAGETRVFRLQAVPVRSGEPRTHGYAVYTDVTARQRYTERLGTLHTTTQRLLAADGMDAVAERGVDAATTVFGSSVAAVWFVADSRLDPAAAAGFEESAAVPSLDRAETAAWTAYESGEPVRTDDADRLAPVLPSGVSLADALFVPLSDHGVLLVGTVAEDGFDDDDVVLARVLGDGVTTALDRVGREQQLRRRERELAEQNARLDEFASVVSHDLRNPLSVASGYVELARETDDDEALDRATDALGRMETLIEDVLAVARQGESVDERERVDLGTLARGAWATAETDDATLYVAATVELSVDASRMRQLLENLFRNSVEHGTTDQNHPVTVVVGPLEDGFYVEDDGVGIPPDERETVFDFGHTTSETGTGFGLAIVEEIAEAHGGCVTVTDGRAGGARFEVRGVDGAATDSFDESADA